MKYDVIGGDEIDESTPVDFYTIGNLIELCEKFPNIPFVFVGTEYGVGELGSWRGSYDLPAITYESGNKIGSQIAQELTESLKEQHYGYKGGEYRYYRNDEFYVSAYGCCSEYKVVGYQVEDGVVVLLTKLDPY